MDSGANTCVTNDKRLLRHFKNIRRIPVSGVGDNGPACYLTGVGYLDLLTNEGDWLSVKTYYSPSCTGTIISPNAIVHDHPEFNSWTQTSFMDEGTATIKIFNKSSWLKHKTIQMHKKNDLWFVTQPLMRTIQRATKDPDKWTYTNIHEHTVNMSKIATYELWHQRLLHPSSKIMEKLGQCVDGVPNKLIANPIHSCDTCAEAKARFRHNRQKDSYIPTQIGEQFHMDFGFMSSKQHGNIARSHDGYKAYLLIVDAKTRYTWVFLSKNKLPPIKTVELFLSTHGLKHGVRKIRTDKGGELAGCQQFKDMLSECGYALEVTSPQCSSQNGKVERLHQTLGDMVRSALLDSGLPNAYWSDALVHSVFIKNRLPHAAFQYNKTPYECMTGTKPNLKMMRVFGSPITTRKPSKRPVKLDTHCYHGRFLRFAKTMRNIVYLDDKTKRIKTTAFATFDEAQYSRANRSKGATRLFAINTQQDDECDPTNIKDTSITVRTTRKGVDIPRERTLLVTVNEEGAYIPTKGTNGSAGLDLHSICDATIPPNKTVLINTGISITLPTGTYGRIASRSGLAYKHNIETKAGVIDPDYTGSLKVILHNFGDREYRVTRGDRVAQLIMEKYNAPSVTTTTEDARITDRHQSGFGSTGLGCTVKRMEQDDMIHMVWNHPQHAICVDIDNKSQHKLLGLEMRKCKEGLQVVNCKPGTPAARIPGWRQNIKYGYVRAVNGTEVNTISEVENAIATTAPAPVQLTITTKEPPEIHPVTGIPQMHFDQLGMVSHIHHEIRHNETEYRHVEEAPPINNSVVHVAQTKPFTRRTLQK